MFFFVTQYSPAANAGRIEEKKESSAAADDRTEENWPWKNIIPKLMNGSRSMAMML